MSTAKALDKILRRDLAMHVAWVPIATRFSLGDYGFRRSGVFEPIGNLREYGVEVEEVPGREVALDYTSSGATVVRKVAGAEVDVLPDTDAGAELRITFQRKSSLVLRSPRLASRRIGNLAAVGRALARARRDDDLPWSWRYRVVSELFTGQDVTLISTRDANSTVVLSGKARALRSLEAARGSAGVSVENSSSIGLSLLGRAGSVGLDLVRFTRRGTARGRGGSLAYEAGGWEPEEGVDDDI
jgi:hypothetical protein